MDDHLTQKLLDDPELALRTWYSSVTAPTDDEIVRTSGSGASTSAMRHAFDQWFLRRQGELRTLLCGQLGYARLSAGKRTTGEIALVAAVGSALATTAWGQQIDPVATAVILVSSQALTRLCGETPVAPA